MGKSWPLVSWQAAGVTAVLAGLMFVGCFASTGRGEEPDFKKEFFTLCDVNRPLLLENARNHTRNNKIGGPPFSTSTRMPSALCASPMT